jgi:hypothetical protein
VDARPGMEYADGNDVDDEDWDTEGHLTEFSMRSPEKLSHEPPPTATPAVRYPLELEDKIPGISFLGILDVFVEYTGVAAASGVNGDGDAAHREERFEGVSRLVQVHEKMGAREPRGDNREHESSLEEEDEAGVSVVGLLDEFMSMFHAKERERELDEVC